MNEREVQWFDDVQQTNQPACMCRGVLAIPQCSIPERESLRE